MKFQETIMNDEQIVAAKAEAERLSYKSSYEKEKFLLSEQAKITWDIACKVGINEVVQWIRKTYLDPLSKQAGLIQIRNLEADLKFKLKEWEVE